MNKDQVRGVVKEAAGKVQKKIGEAIGSAGQQAQAQIRPMAPRQQIRELVVLVVGRHGFIQSDENALGDG